MDAQKILGAQGVLLEGRGGHFILLDASSIIRELYLLYFSKKF